MAKKPAAEPTTAELSDDGLPAVSQASEVKDPAPKNLGGRPPKLHTDEATMGVLEGLGRIQATTKEAAAFLKVNESTFIRFLNEHPEAREIFEGGSQIGRVSLRRTQFKLAEKNAAMSIWLGKQYLGQADRQELTGPGGGPIEYMRMSPEQRRARLEELKAKDADRAPDGE